MNKPSIKPKNNQFSSGPCKKRPDWESSFLDNSGLLGRSHRSKEVLDLINTVCDKTKALLNVPKDYQIAIISASDTGAFECAMWNLLGHRGIDVVYFDAFGKGWYDDIAGQLKLQNVRTFSSPFGELPDLSHLDFNNDLVFTLNGTTSGVCIHSLDFIPNNRKGLTLCDATSAVFSMPIDFSKLDVTTYSWQKSLGGEAQHGILILSPRAIQRLEEYTPSWPIPKIFQFKKSDNIIYNIFEGSVINTPSIMCILDVLDVLKWIEKNSIEKIYSRVQSNYNAISFFIESSPYFKNLCDDPDNRSKTSVCFTFTEEWVLKLPEAEQRKIANSIVSILSEENVAFDVNGYSSAPPSFRIWCGLTIEEDDIKTLTQWFNYAYESTKNYLQK